MTLHFPTHELAALAVAKLRDDGHHAEILDAAVSGLWGPAVTRGVRVLASEEFMEEGDDEIPGPPGPSEICAALDHFFRVVLQTAWLLALGIIGLVLLSVVLTNIFAFILGLLEITVALYVMAAWSISSHRWLSNSILRGYGGPLESKGILALVVVLLIVRAAMG